MPRPLARITAATRIKAEESGVDAAGLIARAVSSLDALAPAASDSDPRRNQRGRLILRLSLIVTVLNLIIAPFLYLIYANPRIAGLNVVFACVIGLTPFLLHRTGSTYVATHWIMANTFALLVYETFLLGGISSTPFMWMVSLPVAAGLLGGRRCAALWGYLTAATLVGLAALQLEGLLGDGSMTSSAVATNGLSTATLALLIAHFGQLQERQISELVDHLSGERAHFRLAATRDPLTGLLNRTLLEDRLAGAIARSRRSHQQGALYYADLDGFKAVNDLHGHRVGDLLLKAVAERLLSQTRDSDSLLRVGGDEFVFVVENLQDDNTAEKLAANMAHLITRPFQIEDRKLQIGISIGVSIIDCCEASPEQLLHAADTAMYAAKRMGRTHCFATCDA